MRIGMILLLCLAVAGCATAYWEQVNRNMQAYPYQQQQVQQQNQYPEPEQLDLWYRQQMYQQGAQSHPQQLPYPQNEYQTDLWFRQQMYQKRSQHQSGSCGGIKPLPDFGCRLTNRCINGQWEQICN